MCVLPRAFRPVSRTGNSPRSFYFLSRLIGKPILGLVGICLVSGLVPHGPAGADTDLMALTPEVTRSLLQHPEVAEANARVCQSIHRLGLSKAEARKSDLQGKQREKESLTDNFKAEAAAQLVEAKTKAAQYLSRQEALRGKVRHAEIRAPLSGTVSAVHVKTIGAVVQAGTVLVDIVPAESVLLARAQVLPQHVAAVRPGQIARLSVSAYDPSRYGVLMGVVQRVATNTTQPENQMPYYETIIEIPEVRLTKSGIQPEITPGMPLTVDILGDKRTVMNYIITPIEKSWKSAFREQ
ncbi:MAG: HlyD family efflux transporter periplasmic adaptor subunit [Candidatus Puniceispirillaceae bacterium]|jgi:HlyD family type I secretion membrane fusion protein